jgi:tripartite-type tricarboxylate transporter receptor subunit TctC
MDIGSRPSFETRAGRAPQDEVVFRGAAANPDLMVRSDPKGRVSNRGRMLRCFETLALLIALAAPTLAQQAFPSKPIRIVVPLPPGANGDLMPRILAQRLSAKFGVSVVIENRPGAAQNLGAELVYRSEPDGYTLLATPQGPLVIAASWFPKLGFDPKEFVPVTIMARLPYVLVAHPKVPVANSPSSSSTPRRIPTR